MKLTQFSARGVLFDWDGTLLNSYAADVRAYLSMFRALDAFRIFDLVYVLTGGGPADSTEVLSTLTYKNLFSALQVGYGSSLSTIMFMTETLFAIAFGLFLIVKMREIGQ